MVKVGCQVVWVVLLVFFLEGSVIMVAMAGVIKNIWETSYFGLQVIIEGYLGVLVLCKLQLSCGTQSMLA